MFALLPDIVKVETCECSLAMLTNLKLRVLIHNHVDINLPHFCHLNL
jgi:hypothetical protein